MEQLKCKVVMLQVEKATSIGQTLKRMSKDNLCVVTDNTHKMNINNLISQNANHWIPQHLYFISNREIKEGDWVMNLLNDKIIQINENNYKTSSFGTWKKIEVTTDSTLGLPLIPQSFVEKYVEKQGKIEEVMIEMSNPMLYDSPQVSDIRVRKDNTVIVHSVKTLFTREDMIHCLTYAVGEARKGKTHAEILEEYKQNYL